MDLVEIVRKTYAPARLVEGFSTLIWTERFQDCGEFELHTEDIEYTMDRLPLMGMCSLRDSNEVMMVESHEITSTSDAPDELVVKGRSLESFLENRVWYGAEYGKKGKFQKKYSLRKAVEIWIWNAIVNDTGTDVITPPGSQPVGNVLPNVIVTDSVPPSLDGVDTTRKAQNGDVYTQMRNFLSSGKFGIRIIRPNNTTGRRVDVDPDGTYSTTKVTVSSKLRFDVYLGRDLSDKIVFSWKAGHLEGPSYLFSTATFKTGAYVNGDPRSHYYQDPDAIAGTNSGFNRRDVFVDGGTKDSGTTADDFEESLEDPGMKAIRKDGRRINSVDAQISPFINFKYNVNYRLGDQVGVQGRYGAYGKKWVTEFIRTQDSNGEVGYPTLSSTLS